MKRKASKSKVERATHTDVDGARNCRDAKSAAVAIEIKQMRRQKKTLHADRRAAVDGAAVDADTTKPKIGHPSHADENAA